MGWLDFVGIDDASSNGVGGVDMGELSDCICRCFAGNGHGCYGKCLLVLKSHGRHHRLGFGNGGHSHTLAGNGSSLPTPTGEIMGGAFQQQLAHGGVGHTVGLAQFGCCGTLCSGAHPQTQIQQDLPPTSTRCNLGCPLKVVWQQPVVALSN